MKKPFGQHFSGTVTFSVPRGIGPPVVLHFTRDDSGACAIVVVRCIMPEAAEIPNIRTIKAITAAP
jgi:hypothetical protein